MLDEFKQYYSKAKMNQERLYEGIPWTKEDINCDLIWHVPIYDVVNRRFAAFSSLLEAVIKGEEDPKENGKHFLLANNSILDHDFIKLCYLFRLCGSGINYIPKTKNTLFNDDLPFGTHGFGNFWIVNQLYEGKLSSQEWLESIPESKFCDVKGYLLPMIKGGLYSFIKNKSEEFLQYLIDFVYSNDKKGIKDVVDYGNNWLKDRGFKRQNFVLTAFAMDMAEYFPDLVDQNSDVYVGSNAKKCLKLILPSKKNDYALRHLCEITGFKSKPYDMEDVACDFIRYINNFQSDHHLKNNNNIKYKNNVCK